MLPLSDTLVLDLTQVIAGPTAGDHPMLTPEFVEREYNNRALVKDHARYFERWTRDSEFVRATLVGKLDLAYGPDPRRSRGAAAADPHSRRDRRPVDAGRRHELRPGGLGLRRGGDEPL